jgi:hypothetical protein
MVQLLNNGMDYKVKYFEETSSYPIIVQTTGFSYDGKYLDSIMLDSRPLMSVTPFYVAFKRAISTESKVYVRVHHTDGRMCYPQCLIPGSNPPVYHSCSGAIRITNELPTMFYDLTSMTAMPCENEIDSPTFLSFTCAF